MRAMILAAGRGERMGELTKTTPKPLIKVAGRYLIEYALLSLQRARINEIVINVSYLGEQIVNVLGDGSKYGVKLFYSHEEERLETGGGIFQALPLLGDAPFIVISSDIITDYPLSQLPSEPEGLAHLLLVDNPFHPRGDFGLVRGKVTLHTEPRFAFASIGVLSPLLFADCKSGRFPLSAPLKCAIEKAQVSGECYAGAWHNVGTQEELVVAESFK